jgi:NAD(P)-dependent dehydrogenase (short-subunit alcohol dehydrogenase family)
MDMTMDVMANSLVYWTQDLVRHKLLGSGGRIFSMTSAGGARVWKSYGAVSAAKSALESHTRQLALELAPLGITVNSLMAGVTDTPALRKIPGSDEMIAMAQRKNPSNRLTTTQDVADALSLLCHPKAHWITGNVICVDGGEFIVD